MRRRAKWIWAVTLVAPCLGALVGYLLGGANAALLGFGSALAPIIVMHIDWRTEPRDGSESLREEEAEGDEGPR